MSKKTEYENNFQDLTDSSLDRIAMQIQEGFTGGMFKDENEKTVVWDLNVNVF